MRRHAELFNDVDLRHLLQRRSRFRWRRAAVLTSVYLIYETAGLYAPDFLAMCPA